jgi:hypothetical protein
LLCLLAWTGVVILVPASAEASPIIFASSGNALFRIDGPTIDLFNMEVSVTAMTFDDQGVLWATSPTENQFGKRDLYQITDPLGAPGLTLMTDQLDYKTASLVWVDGTLYGAQATSQTDINSLLVTLDPATGAGTLVGTTGRTDANIGGMDLDPSSNTMYATDNIAGDLVTIDWQLTGGPDPSATLVGPAGVVLTTSGLDFWEPDSTLYAMVKDGSDPGGATIGVYTVDTATGAFSPMLDLSSYTEDRGASSIAVIPEPATLSVLLLASFAALRRRR